MAMTKGLVLVSAYAGASDDPPSTGDETVTGSGMARAIYDVLITKDSYQPPDWPVVGEPFGPGGEDIFGIPETLVTQEEFNALVPVISAARVGVLQNAADIANSVAEVVTYFQDNAQLVVLDTDAGLQKADISGTPNTATLAPGSDITFGKLL